jgi:hypothetical protein
MVPKMGILLKKELGQLSKLAPKTRIDGSHEKVKTAQHWFLLSIFNLHSKTLQKFKLPKLEVQVT